MMTVIDEVSIDGTARIIDRHWFKVVASTSCLWRPGDLMIPGQLIGRTIRYPAGAHTIGLPSSDQVECPIRRRAWGPPERVLIVAPPEA